MSRRISPSPQQTLLFRVVAFTSRFQLHYLLRSFGNQQVIVVLFVLLAAVTALGIITLAAYITQLPLLFPPLGPSAFILFHTPMSNRACPRSVILAHTAALTAGILSLALAARFFPQADLLGPSTMTWPRILAIATAMGLISVTMIVLRCAHPPAAATALLGAMGFFENLTQMLGLLAAVLLLVGEAFVLNRFVGGLPYPLWQSDPRVSQHYGPLAGIPETGSTYWQKLNAQILQQFRS